MSDSISKWYGSHYEFDCSMFELLEIYAPNSNRLTTTYRVNMSWSNLTADKASIVLTSSNINTTTYVFVHVKTICYK